MSKRNFKQKLSKKNWKVIIIAVVIAIFASALVFNLTDIITYFFAVFNKSVIEFFVCINR
jgi:hypothetical protein